MCKHLRSGYALNKMTKSANIGASMSSQSLQSSSQSQITQTSTPAMALGSTMAILVSTEMEVTAPTPTTNVTTQMTQPEIGTFVPPFTVGVPVFTSVPTSLDPQVRTRFDDMVINTHNSSRDQPYGMPTSMMEN